MIRLERAGAFTAAIIVALLLVGIAYANDANKKLLELIKDEKFKELLYKDSEPLRVARSRYPDSPAARAGFINGYFNGIDLICTTAWENVVAEIGLAFKSDLIDKLRRQHSLNRGFQKADTAGAFFARQFLEKEGRTKWCNQAFAVALTLHYEGSGVDPTPISAKAQ